MRNVFIKVVDNNHLECINHLISLGGEIGAAWDDVSDMVRCLQQDGDNTLYLEHDGYINWEHEEHISTYEEVLLP